MGFIAEVRRVTTIGFRGYVDFTGTANRRDYWTWIAISYAAQMIIPGSTFILFLPTISFTVRRLRDVDRNPWWILLWPVALVFLVQSTRTSTLATTPRPTRMPGIPTKVKDVKETFTGVAASITKRSSRLRGDISSYSDLIATPVRPIIRTDHRLKLISELKRLDIEVLGDVSPTTSNQALLRHVWKEIDQNPSLMNSHLANYLQIGALASFEFVNDTTVEANKDCARSELWYGIITSILSRSDDRPKWSSDEILDSPSDAFRNAAKKFAAAGDLKMAGRCMEELGEFGRLIDRADLQSEGFEAAIQFFETAGATDRLRQANTNSSVNFQRVNSAFFLGGDHSTQATTILGSIQAKQIRDLLINI